MSPAEARKVRRRGNAALAVAALAVSALGLGGPLMLVATGDPSPVLPYYPFGWAVAIGAWLVWLRCWRAARGHEAAPPPPSAGDNGPRLG